MGKEELSQEAKDSRAKYMREYRKRDYVKKARDTYSEKAFQDIKPQIEEKYSNKNKQYSENLGNYLNASVEHLEGKLKEVEDIGIIPQEALTEIALLEKLDTIGKKQMQNIVNRYSNNPLVIQVLSQIGKEHKLYFEPKNIDEIIDLPNELRGNVDAILKSKDLKDLTYTQNTLLTENQNGIDFLNERIDNYINGSVEVRG